MPHFYFLLRRIGNKMYFQMKFVQNCYCEKLCRHLLNYYGFKNNFQEDFFFNFFIIIACGRLQKKNAFLLNKYR